MLVDVPSPVLCCDISLIWQCLFQVPKTLNSKKYVRRSLGSRRHELAVT